MACTSEMVVFTQVDHIYITENQSCEWECDQMLQISKVTVVVASFDLMHHWGWRGLSSEERISKSCQQIWLIRCSPKHTGTLHNKLLTLKKQSPVLFFSPFTFFCSPGESPAEVPPPSWWLPEDSAARGDRWRRLRRPARVLQELPRWLWAHLSRLQPAA